jgi:hypothetical protein
MARAGVVLALVLAGCGGNTRTCKDGTVFLTFDYDAAASSADSLAVSITVSGASMSFTSPRPSGGARDTVELDFNAAYPAGSALSLTATATRGGVVVGTGRATAALAPGCQALTVAIAGGAVDAGADRATGDGAGTAPDLVSVDLAGSDLATPDLAGADLAGRDLAASDAAIPPDLAAPSDASGCGAISQPCCGGAMCLMAGSICSGGRCVGCGGTGQPCCGAMGGCNAGNFCSAGMCIGCGAAGQPCCGASCSAGLICANATCQACGGGGQPCCALNACSNGGCCAMGQCFPQGAKCQFGGGGMNCQNGSCGGCGGIGQPCCVGAGTNICTASSTACTNGVCASCGAPGEPCCSGSCVPGTMCVMATGVCQ